jgi:hypothetical protein
MTLQANRSDAPNFSTAIRMPRISPPPCARHGGGVRGSDFPLATSFRMSMASSFSASRRLSRAFSFSSSLVRLDASAFFSDPY